MANSDVKEKILNVLSKTEKTKKVYVFISSSNDYKGVNKEILTYFNVKKKYPGIYVSLNKDYEELVSDLEDMKINTKNIFFIICSKDNKKIEKDNCIYIQGPESLTELSLVMTNTTNMGGFKYLFFDSLSTLLIYNDLKTSQKFSTYIINKLKEKEILGLLTSLNDQDAKKLTSAIIPLCDECFDISQ